MFRDEFHVFFWGSHDSLHVTQLDLLIFFVDLKKIIWMCQVDHVRCQPSGLRMFGTAEEPWDAALLWDVSFLQWKTMWKRFERTNVGLCWLQDFSDVSAFDSFWLRIQYETHKKKRRRRRHWSRWSLRSLRSLSLRFRVAHCAGNDQLKLGDYQDLRWWRITLIGKLLPRYTSILSRSQQFVLVISSHYFLQ